MFCKGSWAEKNYELLFLRKHVSRHFVIFEQGVYSVMYVYVCLFMHVYVFAYACACA